MADGHAVVPTGSMKKNEKKKQNMKSTHQWEMSVYLAVHTCKIILERSTKPAVVACTEAVVGEEY